MNIFKSLHHAATQQLHAVGIESASLDARLLLQHVLGISHEQLLLRWTDEPADEQVTAYEHVIARRVAREPIAVITGKKPFWTYEFYTSAATLDPRPDSETLIEAVLKDHPDFDNALRILDMGTGTGCLLLSVLMEYPQAEGVAVDISADALEVAQKNVAMLGIEERVTLLQSRWTEKLSGRFDVIISNPPYIPRAEIAMLAPEVKQYDPMLALDGGEDGLDDYRHLAEQLLPFLDDSGLLYLEVGAGQSGDVKSIFEQAGWKCKAIHADLAGVERVVVMEGGK